MKKVISLCTVLLIFSFTSYSQFSRFGYRSLKLGTPQRHISSKLRGIKIEGDYATVKNFSGIEVRLQFSELQPGRRVLYSVASSSPGARLQGYEQDVMGKSYKDLKSKLGNRLQPAPFQEGGRFPKDYLYVLNQAELNAETICVLQFDPKGVLHKIVAVYAP